MFFFFRGPILDNNFGISFPMDPNEPEKLGGCKFLRPSVELEKIGQEFNTYRSYSIYIL